MCVFIYLTNEALKPKGKIHGNFIRRNFLRNILGQRFIFDAENKYKFYAYLSLLGESTIKQQTTTSPVPDMFSPLENGRAVVKVM